MKLFIIILCIVVIIVIPSIYTAIRTWKIAKKVYETTLIRTSREKWGRTCSAPENEEHLRMWNMGLNWNKLYKDKSIEVSIENDGHLCGEYFDFGADKCVIIIPGRSESLMYSYFFAETYTKTKCNILVIDTRSHGNSDGTYNYFGVKESNDIIMWAKMLHDKFNNKEVILHGICVGGASGIFALAKEDCPEYISKIILEGCFTSFFETFKQHMIVDHRPIFPVLYEIKMLAKSYTGINIVKESPLNCIDRVTVPTLFICGTKDTFSLPQKSKLLYEKSGSTAKKLVWMDKGLHSHLRINNIEEYDREILNFI